MKGKDGSSTPASPTDQTDQSQAKDDGELWATAIHESGHVVMAVILGRKVYDVVLRPAQGPLRWEGHANVDEPPDPKACIALILAGISANVVDGMDEREALHRSDVRKARELVARHYGLTSDPAQLIQVTGQWYGYVYKRLAKEDGSAATQALAKELIMLPRSDDGQIKMDGGTAEALIRPLLKDDLVFQSLFGS